MGANPGNIQPQSEKHRHLFTPRKIIALALIAITLAAAVGVKAYYDQTALSAKPAPTCNNPTAACGPYTRCPPDAIVCTPRCSNGALFPPDCELCPGNGTYYIVSRRGDCYTNNIDISGNLLRKTFAVNVNSTVDVDCTDCNITLQLGNSTVRADLNIYYDNSKVTVIGGRTNIFISGNYNTVDARQTTVLSVQNTGMGNKVQR